MPDFMTAKLRDRFGMIMAVTLLAAAWQVSGNTACAAIVFIEGVAPQVDGESSSQVELRAGSILVNSLKKSVVAFSNRS